MSSVLSNLTSHSPSSLGSPSVKLTVILARLERQLSAAATELPLTNEPRGVLEKLVQNIAVARDQLTHRLPEGERKDAERALAVLLEKSMAARPLDRRWTGLLSASMQRIAPPQQQPRVDDSAQLRQVANQLFNPSESRGVDDGLQLRRVANRLATQTQPGALRISAPTSRPTLSSLFPSDKSQNKTSAPARPLTSQERLERAVELSSQVTLANTENNKQYLVRVDGQGLPVHTKIKLDKVFAKPLSIPVERTGKRRAFRVSYLPDNGRGELVMGSLMASGTYAKVRPAILVRPDGKRERVVVKEQRLVPRKMGPSKTTRNALGDEANITVPAKVIKEEIEMMKLAQGPAELIDTREYDGKVLLVLRYMDGGSLDALKLAPQERGPLARMAGEQLSAHSMSLHANNIVHGDGKSANALLDLSRGRIGHSDFGLSKVLAKENHRYLKPISTYASPEAAYNLGVNVKHDSWTLGITLLEMLMRDQGYPAPFYISQQAPGSKEEGQAKGLVANYISLRRWLMPSDQGQAAEVSRERLRSSELAEHSQLGRVLHLIGQRDSELAAYIIAHLLDPNESTRHSSTQAHERLKVFAANQQGVINSTLQRLRGEASRAPNARLFDHLERTLNILEQRN